MILELNPTHSVVKKLESLEDEAKLKEWGLLLLEQAELAEGNGLEDPAAFVKRMNRLVSELL